MAFAEQLLTWTLGEGGGEHGSSDDEADTVPSAVLLQVVELLGELKDRLRLYGALEQTARKPTLLHGCC